MKLFEYQAKNILADYGIPVPNGRLALSAEEALEISQNIGQDVMIKAQILMGGRGKSGGIRLAKKSQEVEEIASEILEMSLHGFLVNKILVEELINVEREIYIAITIDREVRQPLLLASSLGGINVEDAIRRSPQSISRAYINPMFGVMDFQARDVAAGIDLPRDLWTSFTNLTQNLWLAFWNCDATLIEINPLVVSDNKQLIALDSKMNLDDNALFRHPDYAAMWHQDAVDPIEIEAHKLGLSYVRMDGNIGCLVNGAGLAMGTMDIIKLVGGKPANFMDIGGGANAERVAKSMQIILSDPNVKAILINIFGGITRCDEVATGILEVFPQFSDKLPVVVRFVGTNAELALDMLDNTKIIFADSLFGSAEKVVEALKGLENEYSYR